MGKEPEPDKKRRVWRRVARVVVAAVFVMGMVWWVVPWLVPWPEALGRAPEAAAEILDREGKSLRRLAGEDGRSAGLVRLGEVPEALVQATLAAEDQRFFEHGGVDVRALARALRDGVVAGRAVSGASTITQQLVKVAVPRRRTMWTKVMEVLTARRIEMTWTKERILEEYLSRISYGSMATGCGEAAWTFFAKPLRDLSPAESAFLAGLPQAPGRLNPWRNPDRAKARQRWILGRMRVLEMLDGEVVERAMGEELRLGRQSSAFRAPHFVDHVLGRLAEEPGAGFRLRTTLDMAVQEECERVVREKLERLREQRVKHAAVVVLDNASGDVLAMVGSGGYELAGDGKVNGCLAARSPGSALKPFTWLLALQADASPGDMVADLPVEYVTPTGIYRPENYNRRPAGPVSLRVALANSLNLSAVRLLSRYGGAEALIEVLRRAGVTTLTKPAEAYGLGLTIGGGETTLLELTAAYGALARLGEVCVPRFSERDPEAGHVRIFDPEACWQIADMLTDNDARSASFGMASALRLRFPAAVKTGTSTDYRDNWTIGYTPRCTVGVWVGNFDGAPMSGVSGVTGAAPILHDIMTWLDVRMGSEWYARPETQVELEVDPLTGKPVPGRLAGRRPVRREVFRRELAPGPLDGEGSYDAEGRVLLSRDYAGWLAGPYNWVGTAAVAVDLPGEAGAFGIVSPLPGTRLLLDPDLPGEGRRLLLRTTRPAAEVRWESATLEVRPWERGAAVMLEPGRHELRAVHEPTGAEAVTHVEVRRR